MVYFYIKTNLKDAQITVSPVNYNDLSMCLGDIYTNIESLYSCKIDLTNEHKTVNNTYTYKDMILEITKLDSVEKCNKILYKVEISHIKKQKGYIYNSSKIIKDYSFTVIELLPIENINVEKEEPVIKEKKLTSSITIIKKKEELRDEVDFEYIPINIQIESAKNAEETKETKTLFNKVKNKKKRNNKKNKNIIAKEQDNIFILTE